MRFADAHWKKLFLFSLGLSIGAAFCMKWLETELWLRNEKFTVIGLELFYPKEKVIDILSHIDNHVKTILDYHLHFDFAFMAGIFPGAASLCMIARNNLASVAWRKFFFVLAAAQFLAWAGDITENLYLLRWLRQPVIGKEFDMYRLIVAAKWTIGSLAVLIPVPVILSKLRRKNKTHF
jgi:hypothetical protein